MTVTGTLIVLTRTVDMIASVNRDIRRRGASVNVIHAI